MKLSGVESEPSIAHLGVLLGAHGGEGLGANGKSGLLRLGNPLGGAGETLGGARHCLPQEVV